MQKASTLLDSLADAIEIYLREPTYYADLNNSLRTALKGGRGILDPSIYERLEHYEALCAPIKTLLRTAWTTSIVRAQGRLQPLDDGGATTVFGNAWERLRQKPFEQCSALDKEVYLEAISHAHLISSLEDNRLSGKSPLEIAEIMLSEADDGDVYMTYVNSSSFTNSNCGTSLHFAMENWTPCLREKQDGRYALPKGSINGLVFKTKVFFPSGKLLVCDRLMGTPLDELIRVVENKPGANSLNYAWPRRTRSLIFAAMGLIDIHVGDESPGLFQHQDEDLITSGYPTPGFTELARPCHDAGHFQIIDKEILITRVAQLSKSDIASAAELVSTWQKTQDNVYEVDVQKGEWNFYFDVDGQTLAQEMAKAGLPVTKNALFALSRESLDIDPAVLEDMS